MNKKICIVGAGGFGRETLCCLLDSRPETEGQVVFMQADKDWKTRELLGVPILPLSQFEPALYEVVVAIADPQTRKRIVESLPPNTTYATIIHPSAVLSRWVEIGAGSIVTAGVILTCNIKLGKHTHLNLHTTIGHDCVTGDYFTTAPAVNISGANTFGECVYFGTNAATRQGVTITDNVTVGMGGIVLKDIQEPGVYIGSPVKKLIAAYK